MCLSQATVCVCVCDSVFLCVPADTPRTGEHTHSHISLYSNCSDLQQGEFKLQKHIADVKAAFQRYQLSDPHFYSIRDVSLYLYQPAAGINKQGM